MLIIFFINLFFSSVILAQSLPFYFQEDVYSHTHGGRTFCSEHKKHRPSQKSVSQTLGESSPFFSSTSKDTLSSIPPIFILYTKQNIYVLSLAYSSTNLFNKISIWNVQLFNTISGNLHFMHQIFGPQCAAYNQKIKEYINDVDMQLHIDYIEYIKNLFDGNNLNS
jgi:hypothetical protein